METQESSENGTQHQNPDEWLNLSLGRNTSKALEKRELQPEYSGQDFSRVFSCNFCRRKFCSSQAVGGHQNAHRRERSRLLARYQYLRDAMTMKNLPNHNSTTISLGVQPHSHIHKPGRDGTATVSRSSEANARFGLAWQPFAFEKAANFMWPGSFQLDPQQAEQNSSNSDMLDLNLKL